MSQESLQARAKRMAAARARRLSHNLQADDRKRVLAFADDLDAQADALERLATTSIPLFPAQPQQQVRQQQQQSQQQAQQRAGPTDKEPESG